MKLPLQITYLHFDSSPAITEQVRRHADKLDTFCDRLMSCRVVIEASARQSEQKSARQYRVRVDVKAPHKELVAVETAESAEGVYAMIDQAFDTMAREVEGYNRRSRWDHDKRRRSLHRALDSRGSTHEESDRPSVI